MPAASGCVTYSETSTLTSAPSVAATFPRTPRPFHFATTARALSPRPWLAPAGGPAREGGRAPAADPGVYLREIATARGFAAAGAFGACTVSTPVVKSAAILSVSVSMGSAKRRSNWFASRS